MIGDYDLIIVPLPQKIGLDITQNGSETFYFNTDEDININSIDVKVLVPSLTVNSYDNVLMEKDNYLFNVIDIKKKEGTTSTGKYQHSALVKLIDSPYVPCNQWEKTTVRLRFYIYYTLDGEEKRIIADTTKPENNYIGPDKGENIIYHSNNYKKRALWPYSIQLDSIYRPFFFNSALLFFDGSLIKNESANLAVMSGNTYAKFYFSIANGCTMRDKEFPLYRIGDITLDICNINRQGNKIEDSKYSFIIKNNFRAFSEIEDFHVNDNEIGSNIETRKNYLKDAHIRGMKESGLNDSLNDYVYDNTKINGGILLPVLEKNDYLVVEHKYGASLIPDSISYYSKKIGGKKIGTYNIFSANTFDTSQALNIKFKVNDASPDGISFKTNEVICDYVLFPKNISYENGQIRISQNEYGSYVTYYSITDDIIVNIYNKLGGLNVNDEIYTESNEEDGDIFNYLKYSLNDKTFNLDRFDPVGKYYFAEIEKPNYLLAVYHGGYESDEELLKYIKHTNKLLIMRLYKL